MTETLQKPYDPIDVMARSLFSFALLAWIPMLITWILFVLSPVSPDATFAQLRTLIIVGFGIITVVGFGVVVWLFRHQPPELIRWATIICRLLGNRWLVCILVIVLLEINFIAFLTLGNIAPAITNPAKFLLICWTLIFFGMLLTVNWLGLQGWFTKTQGIWVSIGLTVVVFVVFGGLMILTSTLVNAMGIVGRLQGSLDYRQLEFVDDGQAPTSQQFLAEQGQLVVQWLPYNYWTLAPFDGDYINVDRRGIRFTPDYTDDESAERIYFFGGSTMWGEGARDAYTIAGQAAQLLAEGDQPQQVVNYGQTGYVSTQDLNLFQMQVALDNKPDIAVFYQGFNDVYSAYLQDVAGIPLRENQRVSDVEVGRVLRSGQPVLRPFERDISTYDWSLVSLDNASAEAIAERWFANVKMIKTLADAYDIDVLFVWQPALFAKQTLVGDESRILDDLEANSTGFIELYQQVDLIVRERIVNQNLDYILVLTDLFEDDDRAIFYDLVHITEIGNLVVAEAILPVLHDFLKIN